MERVHYGLKDEWNGYTVFVRIPGFLDRIVARHFNLGYLQSTVMLAVDISFLAVPGVINGSYQTSQTLTAVTIYISTILSLGTLVVSVLLADQIRRHGIESLDEGVSFCPSFIDYIPLIAYRRLTWHV
jgi:hypothetical protein